MSQEEEISPKISHTKGTTGEAVILVPPSQSMTKKGADTFCCKLCMTSCMVCGLIGIFTGILMLVIQILTLGLREKKLPILDGTLVIFGIGVCCMILALVVIRGLEAYHKKQVAMFKAKPEELEHLNP